MNPNEIQDECNRKREEARRKAKADDDWWSDEYERYRNSPMTKEMEQINKLAGDTIRKKDKQK